MRVTAVDGGAGAKSVRGYYMYDLPQWDLGLAQEILLFNKLTLFFFFFFFWGGGSKYNIILLYPVFCVYAVVHVHIIDL